MPRDSDHDALSWGDESDPTYVVDPVEPPVADAVDMPVAQAPVANKPVAGMPAVDAAAAQEAASGTSAVDAAAAQEAASRTAAGGTAVGDRSRGYAGSASASASASLSSPPGDSTTAASSHLVEGASAPAPGSGDGGAAAKPRWASGAVGAGGAGSVAAANEAAVAEARAKQAGAAEDAAVDDELAAAEEASAQLSSPALIAFGVIGGIYLLYTVGWFVVFTRTWLAPIGLAEIVQDVQGVLAVAAPALWFLATLLLGARRKVAVRLVWLVIGVIVLIPWPIITGK